MGLNFSKLQPQIGEWMKRLAEEEDNKIFQKDNDWKPCGECGELRYQDARVEGGLKCEYCAYGNGGMS
jgi:hypothetical protein